MIYYDEVPVVLKSYEFYGTVHSPSNIESLNQIKDLYDSDGMPIKSDNYVRYGQSFKRLRLKHGDKVIFSGSASICPNTDFDQLVECYPEWIDRIPTSEWIEVRISNVRNA